VTFSAEQVTQIIALACSEPGWTTNQSLGARKLRQKQSNAGLSKQLTRSVERFFKEADLKPHQSRYWLNANPLTPKLCNRSGDSVCCMLKQLSYTNKYI